MALTERDALRAAILCGLGFVIVLILFLLTACAQTTRGKALNIGIGVASTADFVTTRIALKQGHQEANPILGTNAWRQAAIKAAGVGAVIGLAGLVEQKHPVLAHVVRAVVIGAYSFAAIHNVGVLR